MSTPCQGCEDTSAWAAAVLDGISELGNVPTPCPETSWASAILDESPGCQHLSHGITELALEYPVGTVLTIDKSSIVAADCGYIDVGSIIGSTSNVGVVAVVIGQSCSTYYVYIVSQPSNKALTAEQIEELDALAATDHDNLGQLKAKHNSLIAFIKTIM